MNTEAIIELKRECAKSSDMQEAFNDLALLALFSRERMTKILETGSDPGTARLQIDEVELGFELAKKDFIVRCQTNNIEVGQFTIDEMCNALAS